MYDDDLSLDELPIDAGLPAPLVKQHPPTEPMLPIASNLSDYESDGSLPVALGAKSSVGKPLAQATQAKVPQPGQPPSAPVENAFEMDLPGKFEPSAFSDRGTDGSIDVGLPEVSARRKASPLGLELDLPSTANRVLAARAEKLKSVPPLVDDFEFELPSPAKARKQADSSWSDMNQGGALPGLLRNSEAEARLPAVAEARLPAVAEARLPAVVDVGLPAVATTGIGLPSVPGASFTSTKTLSGTGSSPAPALGSSPPPMVSIPPAEIPELDLGWGQSPSLPPSPALTHGGGDSLPPMFGGRSNVDGSMSAMMGSENLNAGNSLPPILGNSPATFADVSLESKAKSTAVGGTSYGEVSLDVPDGGLAVETESDLAYANRNSSAGLEFGAVPQSVDIPNIALGGGGEPLPQSSRRATNFRNKGKSGKPTRFPPKLVAAVVGFTMVGAGLALTVLPDIGPFGAFFIIDQVSRKENSSLVRKYVESGRLVLTNDDYSGVEQLIQDIDRVRRTKERLKSLSIYASYFSFVTELRHGPKPPIHARADVILNELVERTELPYYGLAQAARAAVDGNLARARRSIDSEISREPRNVEALVLSAEIALLEHRQLEALQKWQMAEKLAPSARTSFGLARTLFALSRYEEATALSRKTLERNPTHIGAELLLGRIALDVAHDSDEAERRVKSALTRALSASLNDFVQAKTLNGDVHLLRSRISLAETSYQEAIAKEPKSASALRGLGETLYRAGRFSEALARFEAGVQAAPDQIDAAVGVAKSQLALERIREAETLLARLRQGNPKNYAVNYWYAKASEASGNRDEAEKAYEAAIELGGTDPIVVDAYVGLALVKNQQGRREEAQKVLAAAQEKLPKLPRIYEAMGQLALSEGRYAAAVEQFKAALERSPTDVGVKFRLGVALRKNRDFDAAGKAFDEVAAVDRDYPGLALERGQLFEASGQTEDALRAFESALAKAPTDPDLMLRVGCGKVTAGRPEQAEELLKKVLEQRPTSAETHHCLGRAQLLEGSNLALALRTLERAVELDPHRAEYLLYVGWAANEAGRVAQAEQALKKALELDQGLGDAYWQRGILRYRQGAVKDAVVDLTRALELRPGRYEAHASLADAYYDLGLESKALEEWQKATSAQPDNATWAFRYGKLLQAAHRDAEAKGFLEKSIELTEKLTNKPRWLWEAHHLLARVIGSQPAAVKHWQKFLELSPRDNVYRDDAKVALTKLGQPWTGD
jgi:tetratricopeptide (TPR) repeat protein